MSKSRSSSGPPKEAGPAARLSPPGAASPASSTSTLRAAPTAKTAGSSGSSQHKQQQQQQRSRGQMARRQNLTDSVAASSSSHPRYSTYDPYSPATSYYTAADQRQPRHMHPRLRAPRRPYGDDSRMDEDDEFALQQSQQQLPPQSARKRKRKPPAPQPPLLGGLYFSDLIVVAFFYALNLLRTCGLAELMDVAFKASAYAVTRLPLDFWQRWSLSRYPSPAHTRRRHGYRSSHEPDVSRYLSIRTDGRESRTIDQGSSGWPIDRDLQVASTTGATSSSEDDDTDTQQLSPFHHLVILLVRFACTSFPHLLPRVLFAEETIGPLVRWRTGGGAAGIVREFTDERSDRLGPSSDRGHPSIAAPGTKASTSSSAPGPSKVEPQPATPPGFRAFWIGADAHIPVDVRRRNPASKDATTLFYLHGGGFSLGSVAFYAEALIRVMSKVSRAEREMGTAGDSGARCVAVEYDLSPSVRFPAPLLQCLRCYAHLVEVEGIDPASITIAGDSAGANLAMSMLICLDGQARDEALMSERDWSKLPMPGKAALISPWADLRPSGSHAFAALRKEHDESRARSRAAQQEATQSRNTKGSQYSWAGTAADTARSAAMSASGKPAVWTEALAEYEWDYVAAEALLHFAQVYAGVLEKPRRVRGPMGWVANLCALLAEPETSNEDAGRPGSKLASTSFSMNPLSVLSRLVTPATTRLARTAHTALTEPLLDLGARRFRVPGRPRADPFQDERQPQHGGLDPLFPAHERATDAVDSTAELFYPAWNDSADDADADPRWRDPAFRQAVDRLENHVLISPALGDWSNIRLQGGILVTWGERERLADDIELWTEKVRREQSQDGLARGDTRSASGGRGAPPGVVHHDSPAQDGAATFVSTRTLQERRASSSSTPASAGQVPWLCTAVEHGPSGVHAWPFVSMYLAGAEHEREKGLDLLSRFIAKTHQPPRFTPAHSPAQTAERPLSIDQSSGTLSMDLPGRKTAEELLAPHSPPSHDALSPVGSLPSDVYDEDERHYLFNTRSRQDSMEWDSAELRDELGLRGVQASAGSSPTDDRFPPEPMWNSVSATPTTGPNSPMASAHLPPSPPHVGLGLASSGPSSTEQRVAKDAAIKVVDDEPAPSLPQEDQSVSAKVEDDAWESDEPTTEPAAAPSSKHKTSTIAAAAATASAANAKRQAKSVARKRSSSGGKRTTSTASSGSKPSSASSSVLSTPKASSSGTFASTRGATPVSGEGLKLDPVLLSTVPAYAPAARTAPSTAASAKPPASASDPASAVAGASGSHTWIAATPRQAIPAMWGDFGAGGQEISSSSRNATRPIQIGDAPLRRTGMTLAEIEALEEAEEEEANLAQARPSTAIRDGTAAGGARGARSRDRLSQILGSAYESDPDLPGVHRRVAGMLSSDEDDDDDDGDSSDFDDELSNALRPHSSPRYVDDGTLSSSSRMTLSMDPHLPPSSSSSGVGLYGMTSGYHTGLRPDGLSDIAEAEEEGSTFDASSSAGGGVGSPLESEGWGGGGGRSPSRAFGLSPMGLGGEGGAAALTAALEDRERWLRRGRAPPAGAGGDRGEEDEIAGGESSETGSYEEDSDDFSPVLPPHLSAAAPAREDEKGVFPSPSAMERRDSDDEREEGKQGGELRRSASASSYLGRRSPTPSISSFTSNKSREEGVWW